MHPEDIKAAIRKKGATQASIAADLGVTPSCVSVIVSGRKQSARVRARIAEVIGKPESVIFPSVRAAAPSAPAPAPAPRRKARATR